MTYDTFHELTGYYPEELLGERENWEPYLEQLSESMNKNDLLELLRQDVGLSEI